MKWFTHQSIAVAAALALHMPPVGVAGVILGSVLPDVVDQRLARLTPNPQKTFNRIHRGASHWFGWYVALLLTALLWPLAGDMTGLLRGMHLPFLEKILGHTAVQFPSQLPSLLAGLGFGALLHVALDMLTPSGVPLTPFSRRRKLSLKLCSTGSLGEYVFLAVGLGAIALLGHDRLPEIMRAVGRFLR